MRLALGLALALVSTVALNVGWLLRRGALAACRLSRHGTPWLPSADSCTAPAGSSASWWGWEAGVSMSPRSPCRPCPSSRPPLPQGSRCSPSSPSGSSASDSPGSSGWESALQRSGFRCSPRAWSGAHPRRHDARPRRARGLDRRGAWRRRGTALRAEDPPRPWLRVRRRPGGRRALRNGRRDDQGTAPAHSARSSARHVLASPCCRRLVRTGRIWTLQRAFQLGGPGHPRPHDVGDERIPIVAGVAHLRRPAPTPGRPPRATRCRVRSRCGRRTLLARITAEAAHAPDEARASASAAASVR